MEKSNDLNNPEIGNPQPQQTATTQQPVNDISPQSSIQPQSSKKWLIPSLVGLIVLSLSVAGYFAFQNIQLKKQSGSVQPTPTLSSSQTLSPTNNSVNKPESQLININIKNKKISEEHFAYLGSTQSMSSLNILDKKDKAFYIASGTINDKTATFFISAEEIDKVIQNIEKIIGGNRLVVELLPESVSDAKYKLRFRKDSAPMIIFSECQGKTKECYFEDMRNLVRRSLDKNNPLSVASDKITINKKSFEIIDAEPKSKPSGRGCFPTHYELIHYNGDWYTFRTRDLCRD